MLFRLLLCLLFQVACGCAALADDEVEFEPIFDGQSLDGWLGPDMSFWSIEDGAITGTISAEHAPAMNQYLVWQREPVENFELLLDFRLTGSATPNTNGGFQFRSRRLPNGDVAGYQVDNNFGQPWKARLYDEFGRHDLALEGERTVFHADGRKETRPLALAPGAADFKLDQWHTYHLVARGPVLQLSVNGKLIAECIDNDPQQSEALGVLALQLHTGPPMKAQFRNLRLKRLPPDTVLTPRDRLLAAAALDWRLGRRAAAHQPPLKPVGSITVDVPADGPGARAGAKVARLENGYFDGGNAWNAYGQEITVYVRARVPDGNWTRGLFSKHGNAETLNFNLFSADLPSTSGPDIGFEMRSPRRPQRVAFPVANIDRAAWHDLVGRYNGRNLELFCDGRVLVRASGRGELVQNDAPILIGAESENGQAVRTFSGDIEAAALWTRALKNDEVQLLSRP